MRLKSRIIRHIAVTATSFAVVAFFVVVTLNLSILNPIATALEDFSITDIYYQMFDATSQPRESKLVTIVDMSELKARRDLGQSIRDIESLNPKVLSLDMVFEGLKEDTVGDNMLMDIAEEYSNIVYSYKLLKYVKGQYTKEVHSFFTPFIPVEEGFTNFERKLYGGIKRELSVGQKSQGEVKPSFALLTANKYAGSEVIPLEDRQMGINFIPTSFSEISYKEVLSHPELITDRIVLFGATMEESDMHYTPLGRMPGVELQAYSVETILQQKEIKTLSIWQIAILSFIIVLLTELIQAAYENWIERRKSRIVRFFGATEISLTILTFFLMILWLTVFFVVFYLWRYSVNLGWAFSGMVFLDNSRQFYDTFIKTISK